MSNFSQADTVWTRDSGYTANTGGRARRSWRDGIANFWPPPTSVDPTDPDTRESLQATSSDHDRINTTFYSDHSVVRPRAVHHETELEADPVTGSHEPQSFFDSDSESEAEAVMAQVRRATSVQARRPQLVEHRSTDRIVPQHGHLSSATVPPRPRLGPSMSKARQILGAPLENLHDQIPATVGQGNPLRIPPHPAGGPQDALNALTANAVGKASTTALPPTPPSPPRSLTPSSVVEIQRSTEAQTGTLEGRCSRSEAAGTLPVLTRDPHTDYGLGNRHLLGASHVDGLRAHPVNWREVALQRAISAPTPGRSPSRKVTIQLADIDTTAGNANHRLFQQSIVPTPYPHTGRKGSLAFSNENKDEAKKTSAFELRRLKARGAASYKPSETHVKNAEKLADAAYVGAGGIPNSTEETLFLRLGAARHPEAAITAEISIMDKSTFDDGSLFRCLRRYYLSSLLGFSRRFLTARTLSHVSISYPSSTSPAPVDTADFLRHLLQPSLGQGRKTWLTWLRQENEEGNQGRRGSYYSDNTSVLCFYDQVGVPLVMPRMPFEKNKDKNKKQPPRPPLVTSETIPGTTQPPHHPYHPTITFHHTFSLPSIALAVSTILLVSALAAVLWVLLTIPSSPSPSTGHGANPVPNENMAGVFAAGGRMSELPQQRVLVGLVLSGLVLGFGCVGLTAWVGVSWVLL